MKLAFNLTSPLVYLIESSDTQSSLYISLTQTISSTLMVCKSFQQKLLVNTVSIIHLGFPVRLQSCEDLTSLNSFVLQDSDLQL